MSQTMKSSAGNAASLPGTVREVGDLASLFNEPYGDHNAIVLRRTLSGDFNALARRLYEGERAAQHQTLYVYRDNMEILVPDLPATERVAVNHILQDMEILGKISWPELRVISPLGYSHNDTVHEFHFDGYNRTLCCYNDPVTEYLANRADAFSQLPDTHRAGVREGAVVSRFNAGDLWRQRSLSGSGLSYRDILNRSFVHRAPPAGSGDVPRLLLLAPDPSPP